MKLNIKRGFNRLFAAIIAVWIVYCLFIYPLQRQGDADFIYHDELRRCYEHKLGKGEEFKNCLQHAAAESNMNDWSLIAFYKRESWTLLVVIILVPLAAYIICRGSAILGIWILKGFTSSR